MFHRRPRTLVVALAASATALGLAALPAQAGNEDAAAAAAKREANQRIQILSFNDFHGHLEATDGPLNATLDPSRTPAGGSEYLAAHLQRLRSKVGARNSLTVAAGDLIGGSTFLSGLFHDEPAVESLEALGLDVSGVGNHEFDEGTEELLRMQHGGCHPVDGCYFPGEPYDGADFDWLAANVVRKDTGETLLPGTKIERVQGTRVGFIGMTLEATDTLVNPEGVSTVEFRDEVETANAQARALKKKGVEAIVVLLHEGGLQTGTYRQCTGISGPIVEIAENLHPEIDAVITGHTHQPYVCNIPDPQGNPRMVTSAASFGQVVTETTLIINPSTKDVLRNRSFAENHLVARGEVAPDATQTAIIAKWQTLAGPRGAEVVGTATADITGDGVTGPACRCQETPMGNLMADAVLFGTDDPEEGGAQIGLINVGGIRAPIAAGEITYAEAYQVAPFGNQLVTLDLTGAQLDTVLEQQYQPVPDRGSRPTLALGTSEGFTYTWDETAPQGARASGLMLDGTPIDPAATYRVGTLNFLAGGGDLFTEFTNGTNRLGGDEDLLNLVNFLEANSPVSPPATDRVNGL
jgi:5'-nucleotidase